MKTANYIISLLTAAVGALFLWVGRGYGSYSLDGVTTAASWPTILCVILIVLAALLALSTALDKRNIPAPIRLKSPEFQAVLRTIVLILAYMVAFRLLGCLISNLIFVPLFLLSFGERSWKTIILYDLGLLVFINIVFEVVLSSRLAQPLFL